MCVPPFNETLLLVDGVGCLYCYREEMEFLVDVIALEGRLRKNYVRGQFFIIEQHTIFFLICIKYIKIRWFESNGCGSSVLKSIQLYFVFVQMT